MITDILAWLLALVILMAIYAFQSPTTPGFPILSSSVPTLDPDPTHEHAEHASADHPSDNDIVNHLWS
jgi:hypothetical protein